MSGFNKIDTLIVDVTLLDIGEYKIEKDRGMMVRSLALVDI